jgi:hypothetical protein
MTEDPDSRAITIELSPEVERRVQSRAAEQGRPIADDLRDLIERSVMSFDEVLEPIRQGFERSGHDGERPAAVFDCMVFLQATASRNLDLALAAGARYLVSRDKDLLDLMSDPDFRRNHLGVTDEGRARGAAPDHFFFVAFDASSMAFLDSSFLLISSCERPPVGPVVTVELSPQPLLRTVRPQVRAKIRLPIKIHWTVFMR